MNNLSQAINKIFKGSAKSFYRFPLSIVNAILLSIVLIVKISMEWEMQKSYNLLFDSLQVSLILGAVFSMATVVYREIKSDKIKPISKLANIISVFLVLASFLLLYFYGGRTLEDKTVHLSSIAMARATVSIFISSVAFIYIISKSKSVNSFSDSLFITHRAFIISAIYGIVIMAGVSGVLGAFQALVYRGMDYRVYQYLSVAVGFLTYTMFLGYFPSFKELEDRDEIEKIKEQPRFIFVLFGYIIIPIMIALTVVLLIWCVMMIFNGLDASFNRLSSITSSYVVVGIWLHMMVSSHKTKLAEFYKKAYPFAGILILIFEAWALFAQLNKFGLKTTEYSFFMIWIFAVVSVILLIFLKDRAYRKIATTSVLIAIVWVLPVVGYQDMTFNSQLSRLEKTLIDEGLLVNGKIASTDKEISNVKKGEITDAVDFISYSEKTDIPKWFKKNLNDEEIFADTFGFEKTYGVYPEPSEYLSTNLQLRTGFIDISDYSYSLNMTMEDKVDRISTFENENGKYEIMVSNELNSIPKVTVKLKNKVIIEKDLEKHLSDLSLKYPAGDGRIVKAPFEDMHVVLEADGISIMVVFNNIDFYFDKAKDKTDYYVNVHGIYVK